MGRPLPISADDACYRDRIRRTEPDRGNET